MQKKKKKVGRGKKNLNLFFFFLHYSFKWLLQTRAIPSISKAARIFASLISDLNEYSTVSQDNQKLKYFFEPEFAQISVINSC